MLRRAIIGGELEPGTHLVESALSERFGVSRAPIRDALKELEGEGLLEPRRRGVYVKALTGEDVWELHNLRQTLEVAALELAQHGITVNAIAPGPIETELTRRMHSPEVRSAFLRAIPQHRYGTTDDVAAAVAYLASDAAEFVTGHVLTVDGGYAGAGLMLGP